MVSPFKTDFEIKRRAGLCELYVIVTVVGYKDKRNATKQMSTGLKFEESLWAAGKDGIYLRGDDDITRQKNDAIRKMLNKLEEIYWKLRGKKNAEPPAPEIVRVYREGFTIQERKKLLDFIPEYLESINASEKTRLLYNVNFKTAISNFVRIKMGARAEDLFMDEIETSFYYRFELYMQKANSIRGRPFNESTISIYMSKLQAIMTAARKLGIINKDPGEGYSARVSKNAKAAGEVLPTLEDADFWKVSRSDMMKIETTPIEGKGIKGDTETGVNQVSYDLVRIRLLFLLQSYTGLSYSDLVAMKNVKNYIRNDLTGNRTLIYNRAKNGELAIVPLFIQTVTILEALDYNANPLGSYDTYNRKIKALMRYYGIALGDEAGTHLGRHIFGSRMLTMGFPMESVSRMMGHTSIKQTEKVYARIDMTKIYADMDRIVPKKEEENLNRIAI